MTRSTVWEKIEYVIFVLLCVGYMGLYIIMVRGEKGGGLATAALVKEGVVICLVGLFLFCFSKYCIGFAKHKFTVLAYLTTGLNVVYCLLIWAENQLESVFFLRGMEIKLWHICINKSIIFNCLVFMIPLFLTIIRSFLEADSSKKNKILTGYIVLSYSIKIVFLFIDQWNRKPYAFELMFLLWLSVSWMVLRFAQYEIDIDIEQKRFEIIKAIVIMVVYSIFIFCLIKMGDFIFEKKFMEDCSLNFDMLVNCFKGNGRWLVREVSKRHDINYFINPIYYIAVHGNGVFLGGYLFSIYVFLKIGWKYLEMDYTEYKILQPVYNNAFYLLFIKVYAGTCYGLGLTSWKVNLPFSGSVDDVLCDVIIIVLLFLSNRENKKVKMQYEKENNVNEQDSVYNSIF